jgi:hypothetical protein
MLSFSYAKLLCSVAAGFSLNAFASSESSKMNEWFALGSGCRAKFDIPGDVTMEDLGESKNLPGYKHLRFKINNLVLDQSAQKSMDRDFGRECAIRLKVEPGNGLRIADVVADTALNISKSRAMKLTVASDLKLGQASLQNSRSDFESNVKVLDLPKKISLKPTAASEDLLKNLQCGEPKIIGFDYTFIASTKKPANNLEVKLDGDKTLDLHVKLEKCSGELSKT